MREDRLHPPAGDVEPAPADSIQERAAVLVGEGEAHGQHAALGADRAHAVPGRRAESLAEIAVERRPRDRGDHARGHRHPGEARRGDPDPVLGGRHQKRHRDRGRAGKLGGRERGGDRESVVADLRASLEAVSEPACGGQHRVELRLADAPGAAGFLAGQHVAQFAGHVAGQGRVGGVGGRRPRAAPARRPERRRRAQSRDQRQGEAHPVPPPPRPDLPGRSHLHAAIHDGARGPGQERRAHVCEKAWAARVRRGPARPPARRPRRRACSARSGRAGPSP